MWAKVTLLAVIIAPAAASAGERSPFHTSSFPGDISVALTINEVTALREDDYDYEVTIGLSEKTKAGVTVFTDGGAHGAKVKCTPGRVYVGGADYLPMPVDAKRDWKEDLLEALCSAPST